MQCKINLPAICISPTFNNSSCLLHLSSLLFLKVGSSLPEWLILPIFCFLSRLIILSIIQVLTYMSPLAYLVYMSPLKNTYVFRLPII